MKGDISRGLVLVSATAFLTMMGLGVLFPVIGLFVRSLGYSEAEVGVLIAAYAGMSFLFSPLWGRFSERKGRKLSILIGLAGFSVGFALFGLADTYREFLGARILGGIFAAATLPAIFAYVTDVSTPEKRSMSMGIVGASIGLGVVMGPAFGGFISHFYGYRMPFFAASALGVITFVLVAIILPESITPVLREGIERRRKERLAQGHSMRKLALEISPFLIYSFLFATAKMGFESTIAWLIADRFYPGFGVEEIEHIVTMKVGLLLFGIGIVGILVQGGGLRVLLRHFSEYQLLVWGTAITAVSVAVLGLSTHWWLLLTAAGALAVGYALSAPTFTALLSLSPKAQGVQGEVQGLSTGSQSLGRVAGPLIFASLYTHGIELTYILAGFLCAIALFIPVKWFPRASEKS